MSNIWEALLWAVAIMVIIIIMGSFKLVANQRKLSIKADELEEELLRLEEMMRPFMDLYKGRATEKNLSPVKEEIQEAREELEELRKRIATVFKNNDSADRIKMIQKDMVGLEKSCSSIEEKIKKLSAMEHENESVLSQLQTKGNKLLKRVQALSAKYQLGEIEKGLTTQMMLIEVIEDKQLSDLINVHDTLMPIRAQMDEIESLLDSLPLYYELGQVQPGEEIEDQVEAVRAQMERAMLAAGLKKEKKPRDEKAEARPSSVHVTRQASAESIDLDEVKRLMDQGLVFDAIHRMAESLDPTVKTRHDVQVKVVVNSPYPEQQESKKQKRGKKSG
ncbi:PspA/IM30 family protein [Paenibacillus chitinolyticus]|uniref:PspA/IM30 family protein n=1 Tax=Paenibacillus chitinolyticus TaxID=79263 RepID=UPI0036700313